jgi:ribosomal protein S18 acetylase RimI-like enzyme
MSHDANPVPRSLVWATGVDVLPLNRVVERRSEFLLIRSPSNPGHFWGNLLLFDCPPLAGDALRWEALFDEAFANEPRVHHRTFAWDRTDGASGAAQEEFGDRGYDIEENIGLVADAHQVLAHPRENRKVVVQVLDPATGADTALWDAVLELQVARGRDDGHKEETFRSFARARLEDQRGLFRAGRGAWYVAIEPASGDVVGSCGVVVTAGRGRFQMVDTALTHRRRGICSRLVVEAAHRASADYGAEQFVIVAGADYHALGLYESLGFERTEHVFGVCLWSRADAPSRDAAN